MQKTEVAYTGSLWGNEDGYYFCPDCHYVLSDHKVDDADIRHKNYCENCGCKLDWSKRNTAGAYINKIEFVTENLVLTIDQVKKLDMSDIDKAIEDYLYAENQNDTKKIVNWIQDKLNKIGE